MAFDPVGGPHPQRPGYRRWADMDLACPGAQVRDARDLAPILASTTGPMARDGGFSYALAPPRARRLSDFRVAVWNDDPSCPIDTDVSGAIQDVIAVLRAGGAKVTIEPTSLPVNIATPHRAFEPLVYGAFGVDRTGITPRFAAGPAARVLHHPRRDALATLRGTFQSPYSWLKADAARHEFRQQWQEFYDEFDVVLMPVSPTSPELRPRPSPLNATPQGYRSVSRPWPRRRRPDDRRLRRAGRRRTRRVPTATCVREVTAGADILLASEPDPRWCDSPGAGASQRNEVVP
ncbi:amidase family protein [Streptomyces sp. NBC_01615]|uniref:amidase family protein n=1 Tax=Streptomyces sp. NBC_01615 TaxID=2975898 RepID=UPI00386F8E61